MFYSRILACHRSQILKASRSAIRAPLKFLETNSDFFIWFISWQRKIILFRKLIWSSEEKLQNLALSLLVFYIIFSLHFRGLPSLNFLEKKILTFSYILVSPKEPKSFSAHI